MTASAADTSYWIKFFTDCGIPAGEAANYAVTFTDNRIQRDQLIDLNKEYLNDMGIKILGDVIAILKHAKDVHTQVAREKTLKGTSLSTTKRTESPIPRRSTAASRIVGHYIGKDPEAAPMNQPPVTTPKISQELSARLGELPDTEVKESITKIVINNKKLKEEVPVPKKRRVYPEHEGKYKITMPSGTTAKTQKILQEQGFSKMSDTLKSSSSVFDRLGADSPTPSRKTTVGEGGIIVVKSPTTQSSVFNRLGNKTAVKRAATSTSVDIELSEDETGEALGYAGVLKTTPSPQKKAKVTMKKVTITAATTAAAARKKKAIKKTGLGVKTEGILSFEGGAEPKSLQQRLGKKVASPVVSSTSEITKSGKTVKTGVQQRLGPQKSEVSSSTGSLKITKKRVSATNIGSSGVFRRLGKQTIS